MDKKILESVRKMSTVQIKDKLNKGLFEVEKKEAAIFVLKQRGIDTTGFEVVKEVEVEAEDPIKEEVAEAGLQEKAQKAIDFIIECNDEKANLKAGEIIGETEDGKFTVDQVIKLSDLATSLQKKDKEEVVETKPKEKKTKKPSSMEEAPVSVQKKKRKGSEIPAELQSCVTEILASSTQKKEKIIQLAKAGLTRTQILGLNFVDSTYVYDLFRELKL